MGDVQCALGWAAVESTRAEVEGLEKQLQVSAPQAQEMADTQLDEATARRKQLEDTIASQAWPLLPLLQHPLLLPFFSLLPKHLPLVLL